MHIALALAGLLLTAADVDLGLRFCEDAVCITDSGEIILGPAPFGVAFTVVQPQGKTQVRMERGSGQPLSDPLALTGSTLGLQFSETWRRINPRLYERAIRVTATADSRYYLDMSWHIPAADSFHTFIRREEKSQMYSPSCTGPGFDDNSWQTFPMVGGRAGDVFYGVIGDSPGLWENRSFMGCDVDQKTITLANGDGSARRMIMIPFEVDATNIYRTRFDGWQHIEAGDTQTWTSWVFASPVHDQYDIQLAAHLALANAKGFNDSALEAILRNTSYLLLRRNMMRTESDYIFISGVGYGWKQWVSDGFWMSRGLDSPQFDAEANMAVFFERVNYEDNAQYFLIWSHLVKKAGGTPDPRTVARAYQFIRKNEVDGLYIPPRLSPDKAYMKTYHDQLPYDDDDAPSSNQGFHCGALMAARELGFDVTDADIQKAKDGYARMFNDQGGYFATSIKQQDHVGQDSLYGEVLTFAVFGEKCLPDDLVRRHLETTMKIQSPYGMRVISMANGDLLDGHSGVYVYGGSWFLNDACNYLCGLIHGMDAQWVDDQLLWRLEKELAYMPAFHESISTVNGKPHGHHLYSWNSGFWWLRREIRNRLGMTTAHERGGTDPLAQRLDDLLGVKQTDGWLSLDPGAVKMTKMPAG
ncbi:MAG TPA: hypothetical protein VMZ06_05750 [Candidatus Bathyarchaeia archaeon]|nr:hypothetical protein [Candidatus Bathyarchaeia archaeon]